MNLKNAGRVIVKLFAAGLLIGALGRQSYGYYMLLRWVVCGISAFAAFRAGELGKRGWVWTLVVIALVFNPIIPFRYNRDTWAPIDLVAAVLLLVSIATVDRHRSPP